MGLAMFNPCNPCCVSLCCPGKMPASFCVLLNLWRPGVGTAPDGNAWSTWVQSRLLLMQQVPGTWTWQGTRTIQGHTYTVTMACLAVAYVMQGVSPYGTSGPGPPPPPGGTVQFAVNVRKDGATNNDFWFGATDLFGSNGYNPNICPPGVIWFVPPATGQLDYFSVGAFCCGPDAYIPGTRLYLSFKNGTSGLECLNGLTMPLDMENGGYLNLSTIPWGSQWIDTNFILEGEACNGCLVTAFLTMPVCEADQFGNNRLFLSLGDPTGMGGSNSGDASIVPGYTWTPSFHAEYNLTLRGSATMCPPLPSPGTVTAVLTD
jgi:hypothetical protein